MIKRFVILTVVLTLVYIGVVNLQFYLIPKEDPSMHHAAEDMDPESHTVYRFSFSKYQTNGARELEIEGDSADIFTHEVKLNNVIAKAYAEENPVVITSDLGTFEKESGIVHLRDNVVATTDTGARLLTEELDLMSAEERMQTEVEAEVKTEGIDVRGTRAVSDGKLKKVRFHRNVTVTMRDRRESASGPTVISCDGPLDIDYARGIATFYENVLAEDGRGTLKADRMDVYHDIATEVLEKIVAVGNVEIAKPDGSTTFSENVVYYAEDGRVVLGGDPEALVYEDEDEEQFDFLDRNRSEADTPAREEASSNDESGTNLPTFVTEGIM